MGVESSHKKLIAWQEAMRLVETVYRETRAFPKEEVFGLTAQIRRAAISVPCNIAEGAARNSSKELMQFLGIANGSMAELETQLELAVRLGYIRENAEALQQLVRVGQLVVALRKSIRARTAS